LVNWGFVVLEAGLVNKLHPIPGKLKLRHNKSPNPQFLE
jgi:hypothetical protein